MTVQHRIHDIESDNLNMVRGKLLSVEGTCARHYFKQVFQLFPKAIRIENRKTFKAYDGVNNTFNLAYTMLKWKVHRAIIRAKLEPYLGFLHSEQFGKPSLVCDLMELYRYLMDDFLIGWCRKLKKKDFILKHESFSSKRKGKRQYLNRTMTADLTESLHRYFELKVEVPRIKKYGKQQTIETLINEEALLFAKYLRDERETWIPRITIP